MSNSQIQPTLAFFGSTGGVTNATLVQALRAGYKCVALVRNPDKLRDMLLPQHLYAAMLQSQLIMIKGDATDKNAVKATLTAGGPGTLPRTIITGLGATPKFDGWSWKNPTQVMTIDNPSLCGEAAMTLIAALIDIYAEQPQLQAQKPAIVFVSTTGVTRGPEDVPLAMRYFYHQVLKTPHIDKKNMENLYRGNLEQGDRAVFSSASGIRPTWLTGGGNADEGKGLEHVKAGTEMKPELGYVVGRADVGNWIFHNLVHDSEAKKRWVGHMCSLTY